MVLVERTNVLAEANQFCPPADKNYRQGEIFMDETDDLSEAIVLLLTLPLKE
jgi:hypothetical protein